MAYDDEVLRDFLFDLTLEMTAERVSVSLFIEATVSLAKCERVLSYRRALR
jgi:hypothetical protein